LATIGCIVTISLLPIPILRGNKNTKMNLIDLLQENTMRVPLVSTDRHSAISELVDVLADADCISNAQTIKELVWERELQRTTGIGEGLAIPHGRCDKLENMVMAMGRPPTPIDFASPDKRPVELIILLVSPTDNTSDHIQALGRISRLMVDRSFREAAYSTDSAAALFSLFQEALQTSSV
jgi:mannitol/fructose-specific phosphotransferase system IIA component (Ntr-type)